MTFRGWLGFALFRWTLLLVGCGEPEPPTYAIIRLQHTGSTIRMVAVMETFGEGNCDLATDEFMEAFYADSSDQEWRQTDRSCQQTLEDLYVRVMNKEQVHATYMIMEPRGELDVEARLVLYGVPSTQAQQVCEEVAKEMSDRLDVAVTCVQGTIG